MTTMNQTETTRDSRPSSRTLTSISRGSRNELTAAVNCRAVVEVSSRWRDYANFCRVFAPAREEAIASHEAYCVASTTAALLTPALIDAAFGTRAFRDVVSMHLAYHYQRLAAAKEVAECDSIADTIVAAWGAVLLSELILFLVRARAGLFGAAFGRYTIESLGEQWAKFQQWKISAIARLRREARPRRKEETENYDYAALADEHCKKINNRIRCRQ